VNWIVERFSGDFAVLEAENRRTQTVRRAELPPGTRCGDVLTQENAQWIPAPDQTLETAARIRAKAESIRKTKKEETMQAVYEMEAPLRISDFDRWGQISPCAVLDLFQDAASRHAESLGCGYDALQARGLFWVLIRVKCKTIKSPAFYDTVRLRTWPLPAGRVGYRREYCMETPDGTPLICGASDWALLRLETRRPAVDESVYPPDLAFLTDQVLEPKLPRLRIEELPVIGNPVRPAFTDLDRNGHINNAKYVNFVLNQLPMQKRIIRTMELEYHKEVLPGTPLRIEALESETEISARGVDEVGEKRFSCKFELGV